MAVTITVAAMPMFEKTEAGEWSVFFRVTVKKMQVAITVRANATTSGSVVLNRYLCQTYLEFARFSRKT
jgi:hypothetical protein